MPASTMPGSRRTGPTSSLTAASGPRLTRMRKPWASPITIRKFLGMSASRRRRREGCGAIDAFARARHRREVRQAFRMAGLVDRQPAGPLDVGGYRFFCKAGHDVGHRRGALAAAIEEPTAENPVSLSAFIYGFADGWRHLHHRSVHETGALGPAAPRKPPRVSPLLPRSLR